MILTKVGFLQSGLQIKDHTPSVPRAQRVDPLFPPERIAYILEDAQSRLLITNTEYLSLAHALAQNSRQCLNIDELATSDCAENPGLFIVPDTFASLQYTSGVTGQPKGGVETHRNVLHVVRQQTNDFHLCAEDRLTFLGSRGRDVFRALLNGAAVYPVEIKQEGLAGLADWLIQEEITMYNSVPSAFRHFVHTLTGAEQFPKLRLIKLVGETLYKRDVELYQKHFAPHCILVNSLGVTETGTVRQYFIDKNTHITSSLVPVGYPTDDKEVLLLDEDGNEVGVNQIGEIVVKSRYLSPGYWRRPELTQAKFFPDPAGGEKRLYHTGDLGMLQPDSCLIHLGRTDFQVKIRGNRVEIGEIETALLDLDTVKEAVVVAREDVPGHKRLVAYIVPVNHSVPSVSTLRRALAEKLPDYMIPAAFVLMDTLPLTGIGKVDQRALPAPGNTRSALDTPFMAPRTPLEKTLTTIWTEVLGLEQIGIHDHFLDLGGNSLLATQVISRAITTFQVTLPVQTLFQTPTIADMAVVIMQNQTQAGQEEMAHMLAELEALTEEEAQRLLKEVS